MNYDMRQRNAYGKYVSYYVPSFNKGSGWVGGINTPTLIFLRYMRANKPARLSISQAIRTAVIQLNSCRFGYVRQFMTSLYAKEEEEITSQM